MPNVHVRGDRLARYVLTHSGPVSVSDRWDTFYDDWVKPVVHFGTPALIAFAVLLTLARVLTGNLVTKDSAGARSATPRDRWRLAGMYWLGVGCLLSSAVEGTIVFPAGRHVPTALHAPWTAAASIVLAAAGCAVVPVLYFVVGRPRRRQVYPPPGSGSHARIAATTAIAAALAIVAAALITGLFNARNLRFPWLHLQFMFAPWLDWQFAPLAYAPLLAVLGVVIVGRTRGIGMGLALQGHDKTGGDDGGLGAAVRARLYILGQNGPSGILVTQYTDVSTLPSEALSLIPEGALAKVAALFVSLFKPATPWRVDVTEQFDGSIIVSVLRNGAVADATVIRPSTLWLPEQRSGPAGMHESPAGSAPDAAPASWTAELRTAAAAFILLTLSKRYEHLSAGLAGATEWRSVALQVIATDPARHLSEPQKRTLLVHAVTEDSGNKAAALALLVNSYRTAATQDKNQVYAAKLSKMLDGLPNSESMWPLRLRLRFNLLVAQLNYAAGFDRPAVRHFQAEVASGSDAAVAREALDEAAKQSRHLLAFWRNRANQQAFPELWQEMSRTVENAAQAIAAEWGRRFAGPLDTGWTEKTRQASPQVKTTLLAHYELACSLVGLAASSVPQPEPERLQLYDRALDELEMATAAPGLRVWARTDPSLTDLHDVDAIRGASMTRQRIATADAFRLAGRFKRMVGDPLPADFLGLPPFAGRREAIEQRGIHDAAQLRTQAAALVSELDITAGVAGRWRAVADVYLRMRVVQPASDLPEAGQGPDQTPGRDEMTTALVFLLLAANLDTAEAVRAELRPGAVPLRERLLDLARSKAVAAPGRHELESWPAGFGGA